MIVIVGGGFAGLETAIQVRALRPSCRVTLISPRPSLIYKPWLIYVPAGRRPFVEVCIPLAPMAARHGFRLIEGGVDRIDLDAQHVHLTDGQTIYYSQLVIATGAEADRGRIPGAKANALFPCDPTMPKNSGARSKNESHVRFVWRSVGTGVDLAWKSLAGSPLADGD